MNWEILHFTSTPCFTKFFFYIFFIFLTTNLTFIHIHNNVLWDCQYVMEYSLIFLCAIWMWEYHGLFHGIVSVPQNALMYLNNVTKKQWGLLEVDYNLWFCAVPKMQTTTGFQAGVKLAPSVTLNPRIRGNHAQEAQRFGDYKARIQKFKIHLFCKRFVNYICMKEIAHPEDM